MASDFYKSKHGQVHYKKRGLGEPLLLVHNVYPGASYEEFNYNIDELSKSFTVYALDLLGFGDSDAPWIKYTSGTYINLINDFMRDVIAEPAHVMSAGLSCAYVTQVAVWRPEMFGKLIFICPRSEPKGLDQPRALARLERLYLATPMFGNGLYRTISCEYELASYLTTCFHNQRAITAEKIRRLHENARKPGSLTPYASLMTGYLDCDLLRSLPQVRAPLLMLWGRQARPTPVEHSVRLAAMARNCRLEVVENAGSWVHDEQSAQVNRIVTDFLHEEEIAVVEPLRAGIA